MATLRPFGFLGGADPLRELRRLQDEMERLAVAYRTPAGGGFPS